MLKPAPSVYIPVAPEGDGIAMPSLLSIIVHCAIIAFIIYSHRIPEIDTPPPIETSIITPEELEVIEANILANREAMAMAGEQTSTDDNPNSLQLPNAVNVDTLTTNVSPADIEQSNNEGADPSHSDRMPRTATTENGASRSESVFVESDEAPDDFSPNKVVVDPQIKENIAKKKEAFERARESFDESQIQEAIEEHKAFERSIEEAYLEEQKALDKLRDAEANPTPVEKPQRNVDVTFPSQPEEKSTSSAVISSQSSVSLGKGGRSGQSARGTQANTTTKVRQPRPAPKINEQQIRAQVASKIYRNWQPPKNRVGKSIKASIKVDGNGYVTSIRINSSDAALENSLKQAINRSSPLTMLKDTGISTLTPTFIVK